VIIMNVLKLSMMQILSISKFIFHRIDLSQKSMIDTGVGLLVGHTGQAPGESPSQFTPV